MNNANNDIKQADTLKVIIRPYVKEDIPFIINSWLCSAYDDACQIRRDRYNKRVVREDKAHWMHLHHRIVQDILNHAGAKILCTKYDYSQIVGWICAEYVKRNVIIHYVYIKRDFRTSDSSAVRLLIDDIIKEYSIINTFNTVAGKKLVALYNSVHDFSWIGKTRDYESLPIAPIHYEEFRDE